MSRPQVDVLIATQLGATVAGLTFNATGANVFTGKLRGVDQTGIPEACVFVEQRDKPAQAYLAVAQSGSRYPSDIVVVVRGAIEQWTTPKKLAEAIHDALHCKPPAGLVNLYSAGGPEEVGPDQNGNFVWVTHFDSLWVGLP